jgi:hypothetical protein
MEDTKKIEAKISELNKISGKGKKIIPEVWIALDGYHALTKFDYGKDRKSPTFYPGTGFTMKVFANVTTGEIRVFPSLMFEKDHE